MIVVNPAKLQNRTLKTLSLPNLNKSRKKGVFNISPRKKTAPPETHKTALLGVFIILNILSDHERLVSITAMFETIKVINAIALTSLTS